MKNIVFIAILLLLSCNHKHKYEGFPNDLLVFVSDEDREFVDLYLPQIISQEIRTPVPEAVFRIRYENPVDFDNFKMWPNLILVNLEYPIDETADRLYERFSEAVGEKYKVVANKDLYARDQLFIGIHAHDSHELAEVLGDYRDFIWEKLRSNLDKRVWDYLASKKFEKQHREAIAQKFGIQMDLQRDFTLVRESEDFCWYGRGYPYRWFTAHRLTSSLSDVRPGAVFDVLADLVHSTMPEVQLSELVRERELNKILDEEVKILRGVYVHTNIETEETSGGPFASYIMEFPEKKEWLFLTAWVHNPGRDKLMTLREVELQIQQAFKNLEG